MKVCMKCDKRYNSKNPQTIDCNSMKYEVVKSIILKYMVADKNNNPIINITEEVVDYYNLNANTRGGKSAQAIAKYLRDSVIQRIANDMFISRKEHHMIEGEYNE